MRQSQNPKDEVSFMPRHRKPGRPKGSKVKYKSIYGCTKKLTVYVRRKGRIQKVKGYRHKDCVE